MPCGHAVPSPRCSECRAKLPLPAASLPTAMRPPAAANTTATSIANTAERLERLERFAPCVHRGAATGETSRCLDGCGNTLYPLYACSLHRVCSGLVRTEAGRSCLRCSDRTTQRVNREIVPGLIDPIQAKELQPAPPAWPLRTEVRQEHIAALQFVREQAAKVKLEHARGEGVLLVGGGRYGPMAALSAHLLRETGCTLPVQIWHRGGQEEPFDPAWVADLKDVKIVDASQVVTALPESQRPRILRGWEHKTFAMLHCGWKRILYLDADAYCVRNPEPLFNLLAEDPFVYWIDLANTASNVDPYAFGLDPQAVAEVPPVQGGQLLVDLRAFSREFVIAHWLNQHSDYAYYDGKYGGRKYAFGDQDQWRVTLAATQRRYRTLGNARCVSGIFECRWEGTSWIVHRCQAKFWPGQPLPTRHEHLPLEQQVFETWQRIVSR